MSALGGLLILAGLVGLIRPAWIRAKNRWVPLGVTVLGLVLAGAGGGGTDKPPAGTATNPALAQSDQAQQQPQETSEEQTTIPGLAAADVTLNLEQKDFSCSGPTKLQTKIAYACEWSDGVMDMVVDVYGLSPTKITLVEATATDIGPEVRHDEITDFLAYVATLPYEGAQPEQAAEWVRANVAKADKRGQVLSQAFGPALYELYGMERMRTLEVKPAQ